LVVTTGNASQDIIEGNAIDTIVFTWGGDATDATVSGLPASDLDFVKDGTAKTITITGIPTANVSYSVTTVGVVGTPVNESGTITVLPVGSTSDEIHNFTESGTSSTFFTISGNLSTSRGTAHYNGLTLTQCLRMESSTSITFTTTLPSTLTLVLNDGYTGSLNVNGVPYNGVNGIVTLDLAAGSHLIQRTSGVTATNLYYMSVEYNSLSIIDFEKPKLRLYPNPVTNTLNVSSHNKIEKIQIYNMLGVLVKSVEGNIESIDMGNLSNGSYLVKVFAEQGNVDKIIIKR
jgi:hypothetical protein